MRCGTGAGAGPNGVGRAGRGVCGSWARDWAAGAGVGRAAGKKKRWVGLDGWVKGLGPVGFGCGFGFVFYFPFYFYPKTTN